MASPHQENWQRRLQELEIEIEEMPSQTSRTEVNPVETYQSLAVRLKGWLNSLPPAGRIALFAIAIFFGFSLLNAVFHLVASLLSIAVLAAILYALYRFLLAPSVGQGK